MAINDATMSLGSSNFGETLTEISVYGELQAEFQNKSFLVLDSINETLLQIFAEVGDYFDWSQSVDARERLAMKDPEDVDSSDGDSNGIPDKEEKTGLFAFFKNLASQLARFVGIILPAIIASLGLSNLGFTGKEFTMLKSIRAFFSGGWWAEKLSKLATMFRENKTVIAIKEFFSSGRIGTIIDDAMKSVKAFFSMEGDGLIAKVFRGLKTFGGKIAAVMGKILYPISLLMSAFDGFMSAKEDYKENESIVTAGVNFITGFVASFIGTFMDLIKDGIMWAIGKLPFVEVDENGEFTNTFLKYIDELDFTQAFLDLGTIFSDLYMGALEGIKSWWENFNLWDAITGDMTAEDLKASVTNGVTYGKRESDTVDLAEAAAESSSSQTIVVNAPSNTTNTSTSSSALSVSAPASASNPSNRPKRRRGGGA